MDAVAQVAEPGGDGFGVEVFDAGVIVGGGDDGAGDGDPVLGGGVLKGELGGGVVFKVGEFVGVFVGEEEKVWSFALWGSNYVLLAFICSPCSPRLL